MPEVVLKYLERTLARTVCEVVSDLALDRRRYKTSIAVVDRRLNELMRRACVVLEEFAVEIAHDKISARLDRDLEESFLFAAVYRKHAMPRDTLHTLGKIVVLRVNGILILCRL